VTDLLRAEQKRRANKAKYESKHSVNKQNTETTTPQEPNNQALEHIFEKSKTDILDSQKRFSKEVCSANWTNNAVIIGQLRLPDCDMNWMFGRLYSLREDNKISEGDLIEFSFAMLYNDKAFADLDFGDLLSFLFKVCSSINTISNIHYINQLWNLKPRITNKALLLILEDSKEVNTIDIEEKRMFLLFDSVFINESFLIQEYLAIGKLDPDFAEYFTNLIDNLSENLELFTFYEESHRLNNRVIYKFYKSNNPKIRANCARFSFSKNDFLEELSKDKDPEVLRCVAKNRQVSRLALQNIIDNTNDEELLMLVAENHVISEDQMEYLYNTGIWIVKNAIAKNESITPHIQRLIVDSDSNSEDVIKLALIKNKSVLISLLIKLTSDKNETVSEDATKILLQNNPGV
jgi:hypothetical protein